MWQGGNFFFQILAKPCALLGGLGACSIEKILLIDAIWCVWRIFGSDFVLKNFKITIFYIKNIILD